MVHKLSPGVIRGIQRKEYRKTLEKFVERENRKRKKFFGLLGQKNNYSLDIEKGYNDIILDHLVEKEGRRVIVGALELSVPLTPSRYLRLEIFRDEYFGIARKIKKMLEKDHQVKIEISTCNSKYFENQRYDNPRLSEPTVGDYLSHLVWSSILKK